MPFIMIRTNTIFKDNGIIVNVTMDNGIMDNGIMDNGIMDNGIMDNGIMDNGIMDNGIKDYVIMGSVFYLVTSKTNLPSKTLRT